ncbi:MAG TPA: hypothetical protein VF032_11935, partial [Thermoleophilaceae bacterium]
MNPDVDIPNRRRPGTGPERPSAEESAESLRERASLAGTPPGGKSLTIGAVCKQLEREFPDISISKIRYL